MAKILSAWHIGKHSPLFEIEKIIPGEKPPMLIAPHAVLERTKRPTFDMETILRDNFLHNWLDQLNGGAEVDFFAADFCRGHLCFIEVERNSCQITFLHLCQWFGGNAWCLKNKDVIDANLKVNWHVVISCTVVKAALIVVLIFTKYFCEECASEVHHINGTLK